MKRFVTSHCLNSKMVAREIAEEMGKTYEDCNMITVHMGGGITMAFHSGGRMIDTLLDDAGPMSPQRAGRILSQMLSICVTAEDIPKKKWLTKCGETADWLRILVFMTHAAWKNDCAG
ncbi:MAG: hypothetical protein ACLUD0_05480 [Eubacterium ramulus]